jgi:hypothetical protein
MQGAEGISIVLEVGREVLVRSADRLSPLLRIGMPLICAMVM